MTGAEPKPPAFRRRPAAPSADEIRERAARELNDLKSDAQWRGGAAGAGAERALSEEAPSSGAPPDQAALSRVQAMVPRRLRDDFLVAARRNGTSAQKLIADFVRAYVRERGERR